MKLQIYRSQNTANRSNPLQIFSLLSAVRITASLIERITAEIFYEIRFLISTKHSIFKE